MNTRSIIVIVSGNTYAGMSVMYKVLDPQMLVAKRKELGYSISKMAHEAHCDPRTLKKLERGEFSSCTFETIQRIIMSYGFSTPVLMVEVVVEEAESSAEESITYTSKMRFAIDFVDRFEKFDRRIFKSFIYHFGLEGYLVH